MHSGKFRGRQGECCVAVYRTWREKEEPFGRFPLLIPNNVRYTEISDGAASPSKVGIRKTKDQSQWPNRFMTS
jgi:hypothetical protein